MYDLQTILRILDIKETEPSKIVDHILVYLRKSRKDNDYSKDETLEMTLKRHEDRLQDYALQTFGSKIPEHNIFREIVSGDTIEDRPEIQKVLSKIENPFYRAVLIVEVERLGRGDGADQSLLIKTFKYTNTCILTPFRLFNLVNDDDVQFVEDNLFQSRKFLQYTKRVLKRGVESSVLEKKWPYSTAPYGYQRYKLENTKGYNLKEFEPEFSTGKLIGELYAYGTEENNDMRAPGIADYLNNLGIKPRKNDYWTSNMIYNILFSSTAHGYITYNRRKTKVTMKNRELISSRPHNENFIYVKGNFNPMFDQQLSKDILAKKERKKVINYNSQEIKNPLAGLVVCSCCGKYMVRRPNSVKRKKTVINKKEFLKFLRDSKNESGLSSNQIAHEIHLSKYIINRWFSSNIDTFVMPSPENYLILKNILKITTSKYDKKIYQSREIEQIDTLMCSNKHCINVGSELSLVENAILSQLKTLLQEYKGILINSNFNESRRVTVRKTNTLEKELSKLDQQKNKILDLFEKDIYDYETYNERITTVNNKIIELKTKLELENSQNDIKVSKKIIQEKTIIIEKIIALYNSKITIEEKNRLLKEIIKKVTYSKDKGGKNLKANFTLSLELKL